MHAFALAHITHTPHTKLTTTTHARAGTHTHTQLFHRTEPDTDLDTHPLRVSDVSMTSSAIFKEYPAHCPPFKLAQRCTHPSQLAIPSGCSHDRLVDANTKDDRTQRAHETTDGKEDQLAAKITSHAFARRGHVLWLRTVFRRHARASLAHGRCLVAHLSRRRAASQHRDVFDPARARRRCVA